MLNSRSGNIALIKWLLLAILLLTIIVFAFFRSLNYIRGPEIIIDYPQNGEIIASSSIKISGQAKRIVKIMLNDFPITINEQGYWNENLIIFPGLNKITLKVQDQFGRIRIKQLDIVGKTNQ
jgi:hypothetical protein